MKTFKRLFLLISAVACGVAAAQSFNLNNVFNAGKDIVGATQGIDEKEEIEIGRELAGRLLGAAPLVDDQKVQAYVNRVGRWIASQSERPDLPWHFGVINTSDINAFAMPGGIVLITRGLYEALDNEAQLGGVLGHEIGHVVKKHHISVMQKQRLVSAGANIAMAKNRSAFMQGFLGEGATVLSKGLDKSAEYEADSVGTVLAARAGYNAFGLVEVLHKLNARGRSDSSLALLYETHPTPSDRLNELGNLLTPRVDKLPQGLEPQITHVSAKAGAARAATPAASGGRALSSEPSSSEPAPTVNVPQSGQRGGGVGIDPGSVLKGIFGR